MGKELGGPSSYFRYADLGGAGLLDREERVIEACVEAPCGADLKTVLVPLGSFAIIRRLSSIACRCPSLVLWAHICAGVQRYELVNTLDSCVSPTSNIILYFITVCHV